MCAWKLRCKVCGNEWVLEVSYNLKDVSEIYHYCKICRKNTFHEILGKVD